MAVDLSTLGGAGAQFFDNNGVPLSGGKLYSYAASTTTPKATFTSSAGNVPHTNPIILDSSGRVPSGGEIWLTSGEPYKFVLETPTSILLGTWDNIYGYTTGTADASSEVQTATAGQTLFVLNSMVYNPGTNTLAVYIDGVNQVVNNSYIETNSTSVTFVSGLHEGAVVKFSKINIGATDASVVSYEPGFTGSVATTVADKLQQYVSVKDFGAVGDDVTDDTAAIQAAIDYMASIGGTILFPAGTYKVTSSLNWVQTVDVGASGIMFQGEGGTGGPSGGATTIIKSYIANGPLFQIQGTVSSGGGAVGSVFFNGGGMSGICLDGDNATGTSQGIRVSGWQYAEISDVTIMNFPGDGITQYVDPGYPNADYSSSTIRLVDSWFWNNKGFGINQTGPIGSWIWEYNKCLFGYNGDGVYVSSSNNAFLGCSFVGNGWDASNNIIGSGIHVKVGYTSNINRFTVYNCEFDFARVAHITLDNIQTATIEKNRFIFRQPGIAPVPAYTGVPVPTSAAVSIVPAGAGYAAESVWIKGNNVRVETGCSGPVNLWLLNYNSNVQQIEINDNVISDGSGGLATISRFAGGAWQNSQRSVRSHYKLVDSAVVYGAGKPAPFYLGSTVVAQSLPTSGYVQLIFDTQDAINALIYPAGPTPSATTNYNTSTGVFTAPCDGFYDVNGFLNINGWTAADTIRLKVTSTFNGDMSMALAGVVNSSGIGFVQIPPVRTYLNKGQTITVSAYSTANARALTTNSAFASRICISLVPSGY